MSRLAFIACALALVVPACYSDKGFGNSERVSANDFGDVWPLTAATATVTCGETGVLEITVEGTSYLLTPDQSDVRQAEFNLNQVRAADSTTPDGYKDLAPLIQFGETLCDD